jgi:hypothetical protein
LPSVPLAWWTAYNPPKAYVGLETHTPDYPVISPSPDYPPKVSGLILFTTRSSRLSCTTTRVSWRNVMTALGHRFKAA